ncbi:unnamed protein product [Brachionus calyciflorus]|uniref:EGF-like domain-containing protein n=1 Tax=Brachionus calyciflorus TaxID=104777 RepID=A0A813YYA7_9BILA|nr:unnamed protein product [Brachionus calyciflorus]
MVLNLFFLILLRQILIFRSEELYVTGSDDHYIKIWNYSSVLLFKNICGNVTALGIDYSSNLIIAGTSNGKVVGLDVEKNTIKFDNGNEVHKVNSILVINSTHFLAGYNGFIILWSIPEMSLIKRINDTRFGTIGEMKNLTEKNLVLIVNVETKMIIFSLDNLAILQLNDIIEQGYSFDIINSSFIFAPCEIKIANDICLYSLKSDYSLIKSDLVDFRQVDFPSLKILNETIGIYSTSDGKFGNVNFKYKTLIKQYNVSSIILCIEILNDIIVVGHQNGSISYFNKINLDFIKTLSGKISGSSITVIKKFASSFSIQNLVLTTNGFARTTTTTPKITKETSMNIEYAVSNTNSPVQKFSYSITTSFSNGLFLFNRNLITYTEASDKILTTTNKVIEDTNSVIVTSFSTEKTKSFLSPNIYFNKMNLKEIIELFKSKIDLSNCITNCSGNGYCKLVENIKLICECFTNFSGPKCEINTLPCFSNKCRNNASCINNLHDKTYDCQCVSGYNNKSYFYGTYCENKIDLCENETCSKNGICVDTGNEVKCKCFSKFSGNNCEIESNELNFIKNFIRTSSLIAIIILGMTFCLTFLSDLSKLFIKEKPNKRNNQSRGIYKFQRINYVN